jgi:hypothetical protein
MIDPSTLQIFFSLIFGRLRTFWAVSSIVTIVKLVDYDEASRN